MTKRWGFLLLPVLLHVAAPRAATALSFERTDTIEDVGAVAGPTQQAAILVDVDHNNQLDLVAADSGGGVKVFLGDGNGRFGDRTVIRDGTGPLAVAAGDLLARNRTDLVVVDEDETVTVMFQGNDPLDYSDTTTLTDVGISPVGVAIVELSQPADEFPDLAILAESDGTDEINVYLFRNRGNGDFEPFSPAFVAYSGASPFVITTADFNRDNRADLAISNLSADESGGRIVVLLWNGNGTFQNPRTTNVGQGTRPEGLVAADFNQDGNQDYAFINSDALQENFNLRLGAGNGTFSSVPAETAEDQPIGVATADFNRDGFPDAVTTHGESSGVTQLSMFLSVVEDATYVSTSRADNVGGLNLGGNATQQIVATGDVNGDGRPDMAVLLDNSSVRILVNREADVVTPTGTPATPTFTITPGGPTLTPTPTFTPPIPSTSTSTPTATPIPAAPYGLCDRFLSVGKPAAILSGDFNRDRRPDLALADATGAQVLILLNTEALYSLGNCNNAGNPVTATAVAVGADPRALTMGDLTADGILDLAVATSSGVAILKGDGAGGFAIEGPLLVGGQDPRALLAADIDRDGLQDVVVANAGSSDLSIFFAKREGGFEAAQSIPLGRGATSIVAGQFDRDGSIDLAAAAGDITVLLQDPEATDGFRKLSRFASGSTISSLIGDDFNRDGILDLGVARGGTSSNGVSETYQGTILPSGDPAYDRAAIVTVEEDPKSAAAGDLDRDGKLDLVVANAKSDSLSFALGDGAGNFPNRLVPFEVGVAPIGVVLADIDLDGILDVVTANQGGGSLGSISILLSSRPPPTPTPTETAVPTSTGTPTATGSVTFTPTPTIALTNTPGPTSTRTPIPRDTQTPTITITRTPTKEGIIAITGPGCNASANSDSSLLWPVGVALVGAAFRRRRLAVLLLAVAFDVGSSQAQTLPNFRPCYVPVGNSTTRAVVGDFDRNGTPDLAVLTNLDAGLVLLTNRQLFSVGSCPEAVTIKNLSAGSRPSGIASADFNANGILDLAVTSRSGVTILSGDGAGNFNSSGPLPTPVPPTPGISEPKDVVAADLNRDVFPDLIVGDGSGNKVVVMYGKGDGTFTVAAALNVLDAVVRVGAADFNRDGLMDVLALDELGSATVFLQNDAGQFQQGAVADVGEAPVDLGIAITNVNDGLYDLDRNDVPDLVFARRDAGKVSAFVGQVSNLGGLRYDATTEVDAGRPSGLAVADFNGDTTLDVVAGDQSGNQIQFFLGDGEGGLRDGVPFAINSSFAGPPTGLASADVDGDGRPDVVALGDSSDITFFLSSNPPSTPTQTFTPTATDTPTAQPTGTVTKTPTPTPSQTPTNTPTNTHTSTSTRTVTQTQTLTPTETPIVAYALSGGGCSTDGATGDSSPVLWVFGAGLFWLSRRRQAL